MFIYDDQSSYCWFNPASFESLDQFYLVGVVIGLAIYNSTILDLPLPLAVYKKLLNTPVALEDLATFRPVSCCIVHYDTDPIFWRRQFTEAILTLLFTYRIWQRASINC